MRSTISIDVRSPRRVSTGRSALALLATLIMAAVVAASTVLAQQPVVFVHGLASSGATWNEAAARLGQELDVQTLQPSQSWWAVYEQQGAELQGNPQIGGLPASTIAFGHSNGGIVAREWSKWHPLTGLATIGTPHQGAPIVNHIYDWLWFNGVGQWYDTGIVTSFETGHNSHLNWVLNALLGDGMAWARWFQWYISYPSLLVAGLDYSVPVLSQMRTGSTYLQGLDSPANLAREESIPYRVGVVDVPHNFWLGGPVRLLVAPEYADAVGLALHAAAAALYYYGSYVQANADTSDPLGILDANDKANWMMLLGQWMSEIDLTWCAVVSSPAPISGGACDANDSLVPWWSQFYPGAMNVGYDGTAHTFETRYSGDAIYWVLHYLMGVQPYAPPPPPDPPPGDPAAGNSVLGPYEQLFADQSRTSLDGRFTLYYQSDGNLVAYRDGQFPFWSTGTNGTSPGSVTMQGDGNLVVLDGEGNCVWSSNTWGNDGAYLVVQGDGNLVIYRQDGAAIWASGTNGS